MHFLNAALIVILVASPAFAEEAGLPAQAPPPLKSAATTPAVETIPDVTIPGNPQSVTLKLKKGDELFLTDAVRINGQPVGLCLIDTGANVSIFDIAVVRKLKLQPATLANGQTNSPAPTIFTADSVELGSVRTGSRWIGMADLAGKFKLDQRIQGIVGGDLLGLLPFTLDLQKPSITFYPRKTFQPPAKAIKTEIELWGTPSDPGSKASAFEREFYLRNPQAGQPMVRVKIDGTPATALIDSEQAGSLVIHERFVSLHPAMIDANSPDQPNTFLMNQGRPKRAKASAVEVFGKSISDLRGAVAILPQELTPDDSGPPLQDLTLGQRTLNRFSLTFDYANRSLWAVERPVPSIAAMLSSKAMSANETDAFGCTPLMSACRDGDIAGVDALLKAGADVAVEKDGATNVLHIAATFAPPEVMTLLLKQPAATKALVNARTLDGQSVLLKAARAGNAASVTMLIKAGADPNLQMPDGATALYGAALSNDAQTVRVLLTAGADPDHALRIGLTPIGVAAEHGSVAALDALVDAGAKLEGIRGTGVGLLHLAARTGQVEMVEHLLTKYASRIAIDSMTADGSTSLLLAAESGHPNVVAALLKAGARPGIAAEGLGRAMPLHMAARNGNPRTIALLINAKAPIDGPNKQGLTPLMSAADAGKPAAVEALLDAGASIDAKDTDGMSPIHYAARENRGGVIRILVKRGADPNAKGPRGVAPLHLAILNGAGSSVEALVECKANPAAVTEGGVSAMDLARQTKNQKLIDLLESVSK